MRKKELFLSPPLLVAQTAAYHAGVGIANDVCSGCRSTWPTEACAGWIGCQRYGVAFHDDCYWQRIAAPVERRRWEEDGEVSLFLCPGCRS
jgi:hypothetical protein